MKGLKEVIAGTGLIISGSLGVAIGNLEKTLSFSTTRKESFVPQPAYYLFWFFIILGLIYNVLGFMKKND
jgi:hypothetical protein